MFNTATIRNLGAAALLAAALAFPGAAAAFELNGFGDVVYSSTEEGGTSNNGFALGQLDLYVAEEIDDRIDVLTEFVIESPGEGFVVDLERLQIGYAVGDNHHLRAGRFHNLIGYWNLAYHHGAQLHTPVGRPFFLEFEDENGVVPVHAVGLWWDSRFDTGAGRIDLGVMFGNGASLAADLSGGQTGELNPDSAGDADNDKAVSWQLRYHPAALSGLAVGFSGQVGTIHIMDTNPTPTMNDHIDQTLLAGDLTFRGDRLEVLAEYYAWSNESMMTGLTYDGSTGYYVQAGYRFGDGFTPYARYTMLDAEADPLFNAVGMTWDGTTTAANRQKSVAVAGFRYDLNYRSALKLEYRAVDDDVDGSYNEGAVQWSFAF
ncbi:MAG: hypothetical protein OEY97_05290 [Nitrospirota bacterium]|nr:hypothetical protein [Nitrospirota bacterium]